MTISLGLRRALQQCAQADGTFAMLAIDQRGSLIDALRQQKGAPLTFTEVGAFKRDIVANLSHLASATLIDVEYGYPQVIASDSFPGHTGLLLALEKSGYQGDPTLRRTELLDGWDAARMRNAGAAGVKLLVYYRADAENASDQEELVAEVAHQSHQVGLPLFLEPLHYSLDTNAKVVPNTMRRKLVIETAQRLIPLGVDVLKAEFPVDVKQTSDKGEWADACVELSEACGATPWVLLSAGVDYETFLPQVKVACENGASGILCGRAVWKEAITMSVNERQTFLRTVSAPRFERLRHLVSALARPFSEFYPTNDGSGLADWWK